MEKRRIFAVLAIAILPLLTMGAKGAPPVKRTPTPPPTATTVPGDFVPTNVPGDWRLVFDDEFEGTSLNLDRWQPNWLAGNDTDWPAFWANGTGRWPTTGEIDIMEGLGGKSSWYYHWGKGRGDAVGQEMPLTGLADSSTGWHTFAADWEPGDITYYFDGVEVGQATSGVVNNPMYLIVNALSNTISPPVKVPSTFQVDYVRVWQQ